MKKVLDVATELAKIASRTDLSSAERDKLRIELMIKLQKEKGEEKNVDFLKGIKKEL